MEIDDLKLELFDAISNIKNSMDIATIKEETDVIYDKYQEQSIIDGEINFPLLQANIATAIASYCYNSEIELSRRLLVIDGMIFFRNVSIKYKDTMSNLDMNNKVTLSLMIYDANKEEFNLNSNDEHNFKTGIAIAAKLDSKYKEK